MNLDIKIIGDNQLMMYLKDIENNMKDEIINGLDEIANHLQDEVKNKFGTYQSNWPKLKRASVLAKYTRRSLTGFNRPKLSNKMQTALGNDDPLVLSGKLHDSIKKEVDETALEAIVYSDTPYAAVHEYGYAPKNIPARSYMRLTLYNEEDRVFRIMADKIRKSL